MNKYLALAILTILLFTALPVQPAQAQFSTHLECTEDGYAKLSLSGFNPQEVVKVYANGQLVTELTMDDNGNGEIVLEMIEPGTVMAISIESENGSEFELTSAMVCQPVTEIIPARIEIFPKKTAALMGYDYLFYAMGYTEDGEEVHLKDLEWQALLGKIHGGKYTATTPGDETITATLPQYNLDTSIQFPVYDPNNAPLPSEDNELSDDEEISEWEQIARQIDELFPICGGGFILPLFAFGLVMGIPLAHRKLWR